MENNSARRKKEANEKKASIEEELRTLGFKGSQDELENKLDKLIESLKKKVRQPSSNTENVMKTYKEEEYYPATLYQLLIEKIYQDQYNLHNVVERIDRTKQQFKMIQDLLKEYEEKKVIYPQQQGTPISMYPEIPRSQKPNRRFSFPGFVSKIKNTLTRNRSKSVGGKRRNKNKTRKRS